MNILYFDCIGGISGNMTIGALLQLGVPLSYLKTELSKLNIPGWRIKKSGIMRCGISAVKIDFLVKNKKHARHLNEIIKIINASSLKKKIKKDAVAIFRAIGRTESIIHKKTLNTIHLHELGGEDTILDVVGSLVLIDKLKINRISSSSLPLGRGRIKCMHGVIPLPAPATLELLKNIPVYGIDTNKETVTPTGAAILRHLASGFGPIPKMKIKNTGYGSGSYQIQDRLNFLRVILGHK